MGDRRGLGKVHGVPLLEEIQCISRISNVKSFLCGQQKDYRMRRTHTVICKSINPDKFSICRALFQFVSDSQGGTPDFK